VRSATGRIVLILLLPMAVALGSCEGQRPEMQFVADDREYPTGSDPEQIEVIHPSEAPLGRPFVRVGVITWEYTHLRFTPPRLDDALPALRQKASEVGGDALVVRQAQMMGRPDPGKILHLRVDVIRWRP
jgi:hypothetical protein